MIVVLGQSDNLVIILVNIVKYFYAAVLVGHITAFARPFVRPSICPVWAPNSKRKMSKTKIGLNVLQGWSKLHANSELKRSKVRQTAA